MQRTVDGDIAEIEPDDPVVAADRLLGDGVEDAGGDPLVASLAHGGVRHPVPAEALGVLPRAARRQPHEDHLEAVPVRRAGPVTAQRVLVDRDRDQRLDGCPDSIEHFGVDPLVVVVECTRHHSRDNPTTGGWSLLRANTQVRAPRLRGPPGLKWVCYSGERRSSVML